MTSLGKLAGALFGVVVLSTPVLAQKGGEPVTKSQFSGWGPSWWTGLPPGGFQRDKPLTADRTEMFVTDKGKGDGVTIGLWCDIADKNLKKGNTYGLMYQLRSVSRRGEPGVILGAKDFPKGIVLGTTEKTSDGTECEMEGKAMVTRALLAELTNRPIGPWVAIRVELQVQDKTNSKYITPLRPTAIILVVGQYADRVDSVLTLGEWIAALSSVQVGIAINMLESLDDFNPYRSGLEVDLRLLLENDKGKLTAKERAPLVAAIPNEVLEKPSINLLTPLLEKFANGNDAELKAASVKKLAEAKAEAKRLADVKVKKPG